MKKLLLVAGLLLTGCASTKATINDIAETASGRITEVKVRVENAVKPVVETVENVDKRIKQVQSGAQLIKNGVDSIKEGVGN